MTASPAPTPAEPIVGILQDKKARDIVLLDLRSSTDTTDYFIICTATSDVHVKTLADEVAEGMKEQGHRPWHVEGYKSRRWILIDYVDLVVHVMRREAREFYALERLWGDASITHYDDDLEPAEELSEDGTEFAFARP